MMKLLSNNKTPEHENNYHFERKHYKVWPAESEIVSIDTRERADKWREMSMYSYCYFDNGDIYISKTARVSGPGAREARA